MAEVKAERPAGNGLTVTTESTAWPPSFTDPTLMVTVSQTCSQWSQNSPPLSLWICSPAWSPAECAASTRPPAGVARRSQSWRFVIDVLVEVIRCCFCETLDGAALRTCRALRLCASTICNLHPSLWWAFVLFARKTMRNITKFIWQPALHVNITWSQSQKMTRWRSPQSNFYIIPA